MKLNCTELGNTWLGWFYLLVLEVFVLVLVEEQYEILSKMYAIVITFFWTTLSLKVDFGANIVV